ncbi:MAG: sensor histidine kinase [Coriobacteriia bacterium]
MPLDVRTLFISTLVASSLCAIVMYSVWIQNKERHPETRLWLGDYALQIVGMLLLTLRGAIPDVLSIVVSNTLIIGGTVLLLIGLQRYVDLKDRQWHNFAMLVVFVCVQSYFTFVHPDLAARDTNIAIAVAFITAQAAWLLLVRVGPELRKATYAPGLVFAAYVVASAVRVPLELGAPRAQELSELGLGGTVIILVWGVLFIALTFSLLLMVNRRLFTELEADIAERQRAEEALRKSEEKFSVAFQNIPDAIMVTSVREGRVIEVNDTYYRVSGYGPEETLGHTTVELHIWDNPADRERYVEVLAEHGSVNDFETTCRPRSGDAFPVTISGQVIQLGGEPCVLTVIHDITDARRAADAIRDINATLEQRVHERTIELETANAELVAANIRLDEATRAKSDFLASMSHELRTPLNSVIGFSDLLSRGMVGALAPEQHKQVVMINVSGKYLLELVNEVLDLSAIEAGRARVRRESFDVRALVESAADSVSGLVTDKGLALTVHVESDVPRIVSDRRRLEQVLLNLLGNSLKFTETGTIAIDAREDDGLVAIAVSDTGSGIAAEDLPHVFDEFYQAARRDVAKTEGTGLGLTLSRRFTEMLGGTIEVQSAPGEGSTFTVRVPTGAPSRPGQGA